MITNFVIIMLIIFVLLVIAYLYIKKNSGVNVNVVLDENQYDIDNLVLFIKDTFNDVVKTNLYKMNISRDEFDKRMKNRTKLRKALKTCSQGDVNAKNYVKSFIRDILLKSKGINESNIDKIINFSNPSELTILDKFEILLSAYKREHGSLGLVKLFQEHEMAIEEDEDEENVGYEVSAEEIEKAYREKVKKLNVFEEKLEIVVQRIYQKYKGHGVIDEIRDMKIDGVSGGVSGVPPSFSEEIDTNLIGETITALQFNYDSVWVMYKGKTVHLSFLSFGSEKELIRVCKNVYKYDNPGQLSQEKPYKVNEMKDGSRVVVVRPPFSESWAFLIRKFDSIEKTNIEDLYQDGNKGFLIDVMKWLIKGCQVTAITGGQGTGKTTLLMCLVGFINKKFTIRIQEMSFELHIRKLYNRKNVLTFRETSSVTGQEGLDLQKKTDGIVNILGEIATAIVASWMIQAAQVASLFTVFTHHATTTKTLIIAIRDNLLQTGVFTNEKVAEQRVVSVLNFDIHIEKAVSGHRYIERITEIIPLDDEKEYPEGYKDKKLSHEEKIENFMDTMGEYFKRVTDRKTFETNDILRYNKNTKSYEVAGKISDRSLKSIKKHLNEKEIKKFESFVAENWGDEICPLA